MQICMMDYGNLSVDGKTAYLKCYGIGTFEVLSGIESYINNPDCADHEKVTIPPGTYWAGKDHEKYIFCTEKSARIVQKTSSKVLRETVF